MVARDIENAGTLCKKGSEVLDDLHVRFRPIALPELPHINNITVQDYLPGANGFQVAKQFLSVAAVGTQVNVRKNDQLYVALFLTHILVVDSMSCTQQQRCTGNIAQCLIHCYQIVVIHRLAAAELRKPLFFISSKIRKPTNGKAQIRKKNFTFGRKLVSTYRS